VAALERQLAKGDKVMMVALLLYAYAVGIYYSRRIAKACVERVDFMAIVALDAPDFRTISEFRRRHLAALSALFVQVLKLCKTRRL
jgi:transposase